MRIGEFDREVTIQQKQVVQDTAYGSDVITWVPLSARAGSPTTAYRFAAQVIEQLMTRSETVNNNMQQSFGETRIRLRWRSDITEAMRVIVHGEADETYQIVAPPAMIGRKEYIELRCKRYSTEG